MPKGIPTSKYKSSLDRGANLVVPVGAKEFPESASAEHPGGIPIPDGVRIRTERAVEVRFFYDGERVSETVRGIPTVAFVREVARKRERIQQLIGLGKFGPEEYAEEFPGSKRLKKSSHKEQARPVTTGEALDEWYQTRLGTVGPNTDSDHFRAIQNQLMPLQLPAGLFKDSDYLKPRPDFTPPESWSLTRYQGGPARPVDPKNTKILAHLPVHLLSDLVINKIREALLQEVGHKRVNNLMTPLSGALERQAMLGNIPRNPFELLKPLKNSKVSLKNDGRCSSKICINDLDAPLPNMDLDGFYQEEGEVDPFDEAEVYQILSHLGIL